MESFIKVGLYTPVKPILSYSGPYSEKETENGLLLSPENDSCVAVLHNLLIGKDFHWEESIEAFLPGEIFLPREEVDGISVINIIPVEKYLECVVGSEMNPDAPLEFVKAHAIISRSWAYRMIEKKSELSSSGKIFTSSKIVNWEDNTDHSGFDVCSDDHCQRYQGMRKVSDSFIKAVRSTKDLVLKDSSDEIIDARYSKCCGGVTESFSSCWQPVDYEYLPVKQDPFCDLSVMSAPLKESFLGKVLKKYDSNTLDFNSWETVISKKDVERFLKEKFICDIGEIITAEPDEKSVSGRIISIRLTGTFGEITIGKELMVRRLFSPSHLYSSSFEIFDENDSFRLVGHGWGHGVGLCQIGAARMAFDGMNFRDILSFYYPGTRIVPFSEKR